MYIYILATLRARFGKGDGWARKGMNMGMRNGILTYIYHGLEVFLHVGEFEEKSL
jgi:hypothetical protein